jgi:hypothetical protein
MRNVPLVAAGLLLAVVVGAAVLLANDDEPRRSGALTAGSSSLKSPNGQFVIDVSDDGILLKGPSATVKVLGDSVQVESKTATVDVGSSFNLDSAGTVLVNASGTLKAQASGSASVQSTVVRLGCSSGGWPVIRGNDRVNLPPSGPYGAAGPGPYPVLPGSTNVFAC